MTKPALLIIGGATATKDTDGVVRTKDAIAKYLNELQGTFSVTWLVLPEATNAYSAAIAPEISVGFLHPDKAGWIRDWLTTVKEARRHSHVMWFLPNHLVPVVGIVRLLGPRLVCYLGVDYAAAIDFESPKRSKLWAWLSRRAAEWPLSTADSVIARGHHLAAMARAFCSSVHITVPMGHIAAAQPASGPDERGVVNVLYVGKMLVGKGVPELLAAISAIRSAGRLRIACQLVGEGPDRDQLELLARKLEIDALVTFVGWVGKGDELDALYRAASCVVVPSVFTEGVPRVIDEAIARNVPVIATRVGGVPAEYAAGEVCLIEPGSADAITLAIERLAVDSAAREAIARNSAFRREQLLSSESVATQHARILLGPRKVTPT